MIEIFSVHELRVSLLEETKQGHRLTREHFINAEIRPCVYPFSKNKVTQVQVKTKSEAGCDCDGDCYGDGDG
jgi:hypothetical protein